VTAILVRRVAGPLAAAILCSVVGWSVGAALAGQTRGSPSGGVLRINISKSDVTSLDPALDYEVYGWTILSLTCAKLVNYPDRPAPVGSTLVPEVAASLPRVSADGRTYAFTVRPGYRFDTGEAVTAASFVRAFERDLAPQMSSPAVNFLGDVVGVQAVLKKKAALPSGIHVSGNQLRIALTRPAPDLLARLAMNFFCAVPAKLPIDSRGVTSPGAGPYYVAKRVPNRLIIVKRNPYYRGPRPHNVAEIDFTPNTDQATSYLQVEAGEADLDLTGVPPTDTALLAHKYGVNRGRFFAHPALIVSYVALNTSRAPFSDTKIRQAANFAISRSVLARQAGFDAGTPTDQTLPPTLRGFHDANIYPLSQPDLARAKALMSGQTVDATLYATTDQIASLQAQVIQAELGKIGITVRIKQYAFGVLVSKIGVTSEPYDMVLIAWIADYADPYDFINILLDGDRITKNNNNNLAQFNDPTFNRRMKQAALLAGPRRYSTYGQLDIDISRDAAPWASTYNNNIREFVSSRVGCYLFQPVLAEIDLAAACIK